MAPIIGQKCRPYRAPTKNPTVAPITFATTRTDAIDHDCFRSGIRHNTAETIAQPTPSAPDHSYTPLRITAHKIACAAKPDPCANDARAVLGGACIFRNDSRITAVPRPRSDRHFVNRPSAVA